MTPRKSDPPPGDEAKSLTKGAAATGSQGANLQPPLQESPLLSIIRLTIRKTVRRVYGGGYDATGPSPSASNVRRKSYRVRATGLV